MFNVNLDNTNEVILDEDMNKILNGIKINYNAFYRGIVVDNYDPERKGRVKVRIPQIYGVDTKTDYFVPTSVIPWATCAVNNAGNDSGTFIPPNIGDTVFITFESGQPEFPIYFGGIYTNESTYTGSTKIFNGELVEATSEDLPVEVKNGTERVIYKSLKGATIIIDDFDGAESIKIIDQSGQSIIMENCSEKTLKRRHGDVGKNSQSQIVLTNSDGDSITLTKGKIHLKSKNIIMETDNFKQINSNNLTDELSLAEDILGG